MITVENLTKRYGTHTAVDDVSFRCEPGTVTGFLGPNGAGQVHHDADDLRPDPAHRGHGDRATAAPTASCPTRAGRSACCSTPPPSTPAAPAARC